MAGYSAISFSMRANIGGIGMPVSQFTCSYEMNKIPSCTCLLPTGYAANTLMASPAHAALSGVTLQVPFSVTIDVRYVAGDITGVIPIGTYNIFCGFVTGMGYRRTSSGYSLAVEGTHWLSSLSFSSSLSASSNPNNPSQFIFNAGLLGGAGGGLNHFVARTMAQEQITETAIENDLWGQGILPWFKDLASQDRINREALLNAGVDPTNDSSTGACAYALSLIDNVPLAMDLGGIDSTTAAMAIADDISVSVLNPSNASNSVTAMANTTLWDKLISDLAPKYFFSIIPFPTHALIVPFVAGLQSYWAPGGGFSIKARDMTMQDTNANLPRATRGVGFFSGYGSRAGGNLLPDAADNETIGAMFIGAAEGVIILKQAPKYLSEFAVPAAFSKQAAAADAKLVRANAFNHPGEGAEPNNLPVTPPEAREASRSLLGQLAHAMYVNEILRHRWGDIHGPLRFDICPGSTIMFEGTDGNTDPFGTGEARFASVQRVSYSMDATSQKTSTSFRLGHIRTAVENQSSTTSVARHPLYTTAWTGGHMFANGASCP